MKSLMAYEDSYEEILNMVHMILSKENTFLPKELIADIFYNRTDEIYDLSEAFNDQVQRLFLIGGTQGVGKSSIIRALLYLAYNNVSVFWYEASKVTNLDDILLSLCAFLDKRIQKNPFEVKSRTLISIDERLISYLTKLDTPLVIVLDSFEFLVDEKLKLEDEELKNFFNYLLSHPKVKLVIIGQKLPIEDIDRMDETVAEFRFSGIEEENALTLFEKNDIESSSYVLKSLHEMTRGYPWVINLLIQTIKSYSLSPEEVINDMSEEEDSFELYLIKKNYSYLSFVERTLLHYFSLFRHPVNVQTIQLVGKEYENLDNVLEKLVNLYLVKQSGKRYYIPSILRQFLYNTMSCGTRYKLHKKLSDFYSEEISKKLSERTIRLSRKLLYSEQHFHNMIAIKLDKDAEKFDENVQLALNYLPSSMREVYFTHNPIEKHWEEKESPITESFLQEYKDDYAAEPYKKEITEPSSNNQGPQTETEESDTLEIRLSEEEMALLNDPDDVLMAETVLSGDVEKSGITFPTNFTEKNYLEIPETEEVISPETLYTMALAYISEKKSDKAIITLNEAYEKFEKDDNTEGMANCLSSLGNTYLSLKQYEICLDYLEKAKHLYFRLNDLKSVAETTSNMGNAFYECYKHDKAIVKYREILSMPQEEVPNDVKASTFLYMGQIYDYRGQLDHAVTYYNKSLTYYKKLRDKLNIADLHAKLGLLYDDLGNYDQAIENYDLALKVYQRLGHKENYVITLSNLAAVCYETGQKAKSINYYKQTLLLDTELGNYEAVYKTFSRIGTICVELGDTISALKYYSEELKVAKSVNNPYWISMAYLDLGDLHYYMRRHETAAKYFIIAKELIKNTISTDSREKIDRRLKKVVNFIPKDTFEKLQRDVYIQLKRGYE